MKGDCGAWRRVLLELLGVGFEEHRVEEMHQRHVEEVEPNGAIRAVIAVAVPAPVGREHDIVGRHRQPRAIDGGIGAGLGVDDEAQRVGRVAVRARPLARHDHLVGGDERARGGVGIAFERIDEDEVAPLGQLGVDEAAGGIERAACAWA